MRAAGRRKKTIGVLIGAGAAAIIMAVSAISPGMFQGLENKSFDLRWRLKLGAMGEQGVSLALEIIAKELAVFLTQHPELLSRKPPAPATSPLIPNP